MTQTASRPCSMAARKGMRGLKTIAVLTALPWLVGGNAAAQNLTGTLRLPAGDGRSGLAIAPDSRIAELVVETTVGGAQHLSYRERQPGQSPGPWETVAPAPANSTQAFLWFGSDNLPRVITAGFSSLDEDFNTNWNYRELTRTGGVWFETRSWKAGPQPHESCVFVRRGRTIGVIEHGGSSVQYRPLTANDGHSSEMIDNDFVSATQMSTFEIPLPLFGLGERPRSVSASFDPAGRLHLIYSKNQSSEPLFNEQGDPVGTEVRSSLFYSRRDLTGDWSPPVEMNSPGSGFGDGGLGACVAAAPDGTVAIAAAFVPRVRTGSTARYAELRYMVLQPDGSWSQSVVANRSDGFVAGDGEMGTGLEPWLVFDSSSRPRIVFTDHASQHWPSCWSYSGQVRLATRSSPTSGAWEVAKLVSRGNRAAVDFTTWRPSIAVRGGSVYITACSVGFNEREITFAPQYDFIERFTSEPPAPSSEATFIARAPGGFAFLSSANSSLGVALAPGGNDWSIPSDAAGKTGLATINPRRILSRLAELPVTSWRYKGDPGRRYYGPMAQDFFQAFGLGTEDKLISTVDFDGVALAAIQGLVVEIRSRRQRSAEQARRLMELQRELAALQSAVRNDSRGHPPAPEEKLGAQASDSR